MPFLLRVFDAIPTNLIAEIPGGAEYEEVVRLADVSGCDCELYHDLTEEHILLRI